MKMKMKMKRNLTWNPKWNSVGDGTSGETYNNWVKSGFRHHVRQP
jgi:hypothetical protein